jgi:hypothetical protein
MINRKNGLTFLLAAMLLFSGQLCAQGTVFFSAPVAITTDGNHALASMLERIGHLYSTPIDFEEAPIEHPSDMVVGPVMMKSGLHPVFARGGKLTVQLDKNDVDAYQAVLTVLAAYTNSGLPGSYQAFTEGDRVDVIPMQARGSDGFTHNVIPIMASKISLDYKARSTYSLLDDISSAISKVSGRTVYASITGAPESMAPGEISGFSGGTARSVLATIAGFSYQALFDPGANAYYLNVQPAAIRSAPGPSTVTKRNTTGLPQTSPFWVKE